MKRTQRPIALYELVNQLTEVIGRVSATQASYFLQEFLGHEEKEMLAKRLAMVVMISEGHSLYAIAQVLRVSQSTVGKIYDRYERKEFTQTLKALRKNKVDYLQFIHTAPVQRRFQPKVNGSSPAGATKTRR